MTLDEKVAQLETVWEHKDKIQTPDGNFSPRARRRTFPNGIGQIARPSDRRGVTQSGGGGRGGGGRRTDAMPARPRSISTPRSIGRSSTRGSASRS